MNQCNSLNIKLSNSQLNKLKSVIKNKTEKVFRLPSNMIGNFDDKANFPRELFLTNRHVANLRKAFANNSSTDIKLSNFSYLRWYNQEDLQTSWSITKNWITFSKKRN